MMANALFAFDNPAVARRVHDRLIAAGLPEATLKLKGLGGPASGPHANGVDDLATGGMVGSLHHLLQGLFDGAPVARDAGPEATARRSAGAVLRVRGASPGQQAAIDAAILAVGCSRRTDWSPTSGR